jgi:hypothetical protein
MVQLKQLAGGTADVVIRVVRDLRSDAAALAAASDAARLTGRPSSAMPQREVQRHIEVLLDAVIATLEDSGDVTGALRAADALAADRAQQGIPLSVVLDGFQSARTFFIRNILSTHGTVVGSPEDLIELFVPIDDAVSELHTRMIHAYREAERALARSGRAARIDALRALLEGGPVTWAQQAELDLTRPYHCILADVTNPRESRRMEALLETAEGLSGIVRGYLCRVSPQSPPANRVGEDVLVVVAAPVPPHELALSYKLCREALTAGRARGLRGMHSVTDVAVGVAVDAQPLLGRMLAAEHLATLDPGDAFHRLLAETARVYLEHGSRVDPTAAALHVHPNTVKYRIRRLSELTQFDTAGAPGETLDRSVRWWWALDAWLSGRRP